MSGLLNIARWEWFRLVRRKMPWILLAIFFAFTQLAVWGSYVAYERTATARSRYMGQMGGGMGMPNIDCSQLRSGNAPPGTAPQTIERARRMCEQRETSILTRYLTLSPLGAVSSALGVAASIGLILLGILSASTVGMDYGLGTLRPILARGAGRMSFLAGRYAMLIGAATAAMLLVCAAAAGSGYLAAQIAAPPPQGALAGTTFGDIGILFAKTWAAVVTYVTLACAVTLLVRSTAAGMAISLAWYVAEAILIRLLGAVFESFDKVADYLPMRNISALTSSGDRLAALLGSGNEISTLHASLVLAAYLLLFAAIAAVVFNRRDVGGAGGS